MTTYIPCPRGNKCWSGVGRHVPGSKELLRCLQGSTSTADLSSYGVPDDFINGDRVYITPDISTPDTIIADLDLYEHGESNKYTLYYEEHNNRESTSVYLYENDDNKVVYETEYQLGTSPYSYSSRIIDEEFQLPEGINRYPDCRLMSELRSAGSDAVIEEFKNRVSSYDEGIELTHSGDNGLWKSYNVSLAYTIPDEESAGNTVSDLTDHIDDIGFRDYYESDEFKSKIKEKLEEAGINQISESGYGLVTSRWSVVKRKNNSRIDDKDIESVYDAGQKIGLEEPSQYRSLAKSTVMIGTKEEAESDEGDNIIIQFNDDTWLAYDKNRYNS